MAMRRHLINITVFMSVFVMVFIGAQVFVTRSSADHAGASWPNATCDENGEYLHVHWERTSGTVNVFYKLEIFNESGATGQYQGVVDNKVTAWNAGQSFVDLFQDNFSPDWDVLVRVTDFGTTPWLGQTTHDPSACVAPANNQSTHLVFDGNTRVWINSKVIEAKGNPNHARQWTVAHELGHVLGLGHDIDNASTRVMYWSYNAGESLPTSPQSGDISRLSSQCDPYGHTHGSGC